MRINLQQQRVAAEAGESGAAVEIVLLPATYFSMACLAMGQWWSGHSWTTIQTFMSTLRVINCSYLPGWDPQNQGQTRYWSSEPLVLSAAWQCPASECSHFKKTDILGFFCGERLHHQLNSKSKTVKKYLWEIWELKYDPWTVRMVWNL